VGEVKGGTTGCRNVRNLQPDKQVCTVPDGIQHAGASVVKTFYQTNSFVTLQPAKCTVWCAISKQQLIGLIFVESSSHSGHFGSRVCGHIFQQDGVHPHTAYIILDILHGMFGSHVLPN